MDDALTEHSLVALISPYVPTTREHVQVGLTARGRDLDERAIGLDGKVRRVESEIHEEGCAVALSIVVREVIERVVPHGSRLVKVLRAVAVNARGDRVAFRLEAVFAFHPLVGFRAASLRTAAENV